MNGTLVKRYKRSWSIKLEWRDPLTGARKQKWYSVKGPKRDAQAKLHDLMADTQKGSVISATAKETVGTLLKRWLDEHAAQNVRAKTLQEYRAMADRHLVPGLGQVKLSGLQPAHLSALYRQARECGGRDGRPLSAQTVLHHHRLLSTVLNWAVKQGLLARNPAAAADPPRPRKNLELRTLSPEQVHRLLEVAEGSEYKPIIHLALLTGLRRSELLGLTWSSVDLLGASLQVTQSLHWVRDRQEFVTEAPKSARGKRNIALSPEATALLRTHMEDETAKALLFGRTLTDEDYVFTRVDGFPRQPDSVTHGFLAIARKTGLQRVRFHDLRHTHASLMLAGGVHPKVVSERLGHSSVNITLDQYSHVLPGLQEAAALRLDSILADAASPATGTDGFHEAVSDTGVESRVAVT